MTKNAGDMTRVQQALERLRRAMRERLFMLIVFGNLIGLPILPPYYSIRLLPFILPGARGGERGQA